MDRKEAVARALEFAAKKENLEADAVAQQQIRDFLARYPYKAKPDLLSKMTPDDLYRSNANDRFFDLLEKRTGNVGQIRMYEVAVYAEAVKRIDFFKVVFTVLVSEKRSISFKIDQNWGIIPGFGDDKLIAKKLLSLYYHENVVPIFRTDDLERFSSMLGINYRNSSLQRYRKNYAALTVGQKFELLNIGLVQFKTTHLDKWTNTQFARFLYQISAPQAAAPAPAAAQQGIAAPAAAPQSGMVSAGQPSDSRIRLADRTIKELKDEIAHRESEARRAEEAMRLKEDDIRKREENLNQREDVMRQELAKMPKQTAINKASEEEIAKTIQLYETRLKVAENTIRELRSDVETRLSSARQAEEAMRLKEEATRKREESLLESNETTRQELEQLDARRQQEMSERTDLMKTIEELTDQLKEKEEKIESMEKEIFLNKSVIKIGESDFMDGHVGVFKAPEPSEADAVKVKTGTPRLDDLLMGGIPLGSQFVVYGPGFIGKEVALDAFAASSITSGIPVIWVTTDKTIEEIRDEMSAVMDDFQSYEKKGMVYYVDAYSRIVGDNSTAENAAYLEDGANVENIGTLVDKRISKLQALVREKGYRLIFRSVSSLSANHDIKSIFALLRQFVARRRKDKCVAAYSIEKGIVSEQDLQILSSIMDGVIEFTTDGKTHHLTIQGICETQTRDKVQYTATKAALNIGSFFLGRIK